MLTLYHAPGTRSSAILWLLEELEVPYKVERIPIVYNDGKGGPAPESYRAIHPHKKVPALDHDGTVLFESAAIALYLADAFPDKRLAPPIGDKARAAYLTWLAYYAGSIGPIFVARFRGWDSELPSSFGTFEEMESFMAKTLEAHPYIAGDAFSAADVLLGGAVRYFKGRFLPERRCYDDYVARLEKRPAFQRALARDNG